MCSLKQLNNFVINYYDKESFLNTYYFNDKKEHVIIVAFLILIYDKNILFLSQLYNNIGEVFLGHFLCFMINLFHYKY